MGALKLKSDSNNFNFNLNRKDIGKADTLRHNILVYVSEENYDRAIQELKSFFDRESEYPKFKDKIDRYISYSVDLVNAIRAKRKFPGMNSLTTAKQQEIIEKFHFHYEELKQTLKKIEKIHQELEVEDRRSTIILVKAVVNAAIAIAILAFILESSRGLVSNIFEVSDGYVSSVTDFIFQKIGF